MTKAEANVTMLMRLFRLDHSIMGKPAVNYIRQAVVYWESVVDGVNGKVEPCRRPHQELAKVVHPPGERSNAFALSANA